MAGSEPFLSTSWYRVAQLRPRLREHARVRLHRYRGAPWYVVTDVATGRVHRLAPSAFGIIARMDGERTLNELWVEAAERLGEQAPTQDQVIRLLGQLHVADLLQGDVPPDARELIERFSRQENRRLWRGLLNPMALRFRLWNPDRFLKRALPLVAPCFSWFGALLWLAVVVPALVLAAEHWPELSANFTDRMLSEGNLVVLALCFPALKFLHELGHGFATKKYGGAVHDMGIMFLVLFPMPYVDASASAGFRSKLSRIIVGAAGMLVETFLAALALYVWLLVEPGNLRAIAFNIMVTASITTVLFNGNPLLRYDGYYMLSDVIEIPNLAQRASRYWGHLIERHVFRSESAASSVPSLGERIWFVIYAPASSTYRIAVMFGIALFLAERYLAVGVVLALWTIATTILLPVGKAFRHVLISPSLRRSRTRAVGLTFGGVAACLALLLLVPAPLHTVTEGVIWLPDDAVVRAGTDGFAARILAEPGSLLRAGDPLIENDEPILRAELAYSRARVAELQAQLASEQFTKLSDAVVTRTELDQARADLAEREDRVARLVTRTRADGVAVIPQPADLPGRYAREGDVIGYVLPLSGPRIVRATVPQDDIDLVRRHLHSVAVKLADHLSETYQARLVREVPAGRDELPSKALGAGGGGAVAVDPRDTHGTKTLQRVFQVDLQLPPEAPAEGFGARAYVRFEHEWEPLGDQLYRRLRQLLLSRMQT